MAITVRNATPISTGLLTNVVPAHSDVISKMGSHNTSIWAREYLKHLRHLRGPQLFTPAADLAQQSSQVGDLQRLQLLSSTHTR
jgi:hypothetical protein